MRILLGTIVVAAVLGGLYWLLGAEPEVPTAPGQADPPAPAKNGGTAHEGVPVPKVADSVDRRVEAAPAIDSPSPEKSGSPPVPFEATSSGRLRMRVLDAVAASPVEVLAARVVSDARFALISRNPVDELLSPGEYRCVLKSPGHEPRELEPFVIREGEVTDLGTVYLDRGAAVITASVTGPGHGDHYVEVHDGDRRPCDVCDPTLHALDVAAGRCDKCGQARPRRGVPTADGRKFRFAGLGAGAYHVLACRRGNRVVERTVDVRLAVGEHRDVVLKVDDRIDMEVQVYDATRKPFEGWWEEKGEVFVAPLRLHFAIGPVHVADGAIDPVIPAHYRGPAEAGSTPAAGARGSGGQKPRAKMRADKRRGQSPRTALWPPLLPPRVEVVTLPVERAGEGLYRVRGVPRLASQVIASCGPFFSPATKLDLTAESGNTAEVVFVGRCNASSKLLAPRGKGQKPISCNACHQLPRTVGFGR